MRFTSPATSRLMRTASLGPAAIVAVADQVRRVNLGLPQARFVSAEMMRRGGSVGSQSRAAPTALGCLCGPGDPGFFGDIAPPFVKVGPVAMRIIQMRRGGASPQAALLDAYARLHLAGVQTISHDVHLQIAAGMQPLAVGTASFQGFGALGLAPVIGAATTGGAVAGSAIGGAAAGALGIGAGIALGQTVIPIPVVGAVIGAAIYEAVHLMQRHVGKAEASWTAPGFYASLNTTAGRDYDEHQFSEAFKGMMDTGNNIIPGCGADRHKDPDCLLGPMANVIAQGYLSQTVPLSATSADVYNKVVVPWLSSGAGGLVNWNVLKAEPIQQKMLAAAADRYLAGEAMTRGDMPSYGNNGAHTVPLVTALAPLLAAMTPTTTTPQPTPTTPPVVSNPTTGYVQPISTVPPPADNLGPAMPTGGGLQIAPGVTPQPVVSSPAGSVSYGPAVGYAPTPVASMPAVTTASIGGGLPTWAMLAIAAIGLGFVFFKQGPVTSPPKV